SLPSSTSRTLSKESLSPFAYSPLIFSMVTTLPSETLYCLPPVCITANSMGLILQDISQKGKLLLYYSLYERDEIYRKILFLRTLAGYSPFCFSYLPTFLGSLSFRCFFCD